jgi:glycosyltransferase involved in cell wall biosynthesis
MRILTLHNRYRFRGGEDESTESEIELLRERGHEIRTVFADNQSLSDEAAWKAGLSAVWNHASYRNTRRTIRDFRPDLVKVHNFFPLLSPSVHYAAQAEGVPVVQALHNYRLLCPGANFSRNGSVCEQCSSKPLAWPGILHGCYRSSRTATAAAAAMSAAHRLAGTWRERVQAFIAPSEFARHKFEEAGFPGEKLVVKPNFLVRDPGRGSGGQHFALFVGRLSPEKGIGTLLDAWQEAGKRLSLRIVGDGPLAGMVRQRAHRLPNVHVLGPRPIENVYELMGEAAFLVLPSECFETFGRVAVEAFAKGTPVVASNLGAMAEVVDDGRTGLLFRAGDAADLAAKVEWMASHPAEVRRMREEARAEFLAKYTAERNYRALMEIYERAIEGRAAERQPRAAAAQAAGHAG